MGQETPIKTKIGRYHKSHPCFTFYILCKIKKLYFLFDYLFYEPSNY